MCENEAAELYHMWQENAEETESQDIQNHHQALLVCGADVHALTKTKQGEAFGYDGNVEAYQGCDTWY